jgi:hypothetical protein
LGGHKADIRTNVEDNRSINPLQKIREEADLAFFKLSIQEQVVSDVRSRVIFQIGPIKLV